MTAFAPASRTWLRSARFDVWLQLGALAGVAPALAIYSFFGSAIGSEWLPMASLIAIPFFHVFGSFFFAFSNERNRSAWPPRKLAVYWALWCVAVVVIREVAPRALATFALLYGGWHILRQNFGFLRELSHRSGLAGDRLLRHLDLAACLAPAIALWVLVASRGPWRFIAADVYHPHVPGWLLVVALVAVPSTAAVRLYRAWSRAGLLLLIGNCAALLVPAMLLSDLVLIYTLSASFHGLQYLAYLAERERERSPRADPTSVLYPMASAIVLAMLGWTLTLLAMGAGFSSQGAEQALLLGWYVLVPFHYFVDGRIWRRPARPLGARVVQG